MVQLYSPVGADFRVDSTAASDQWYPTVTGLADGGFVVSWMSLSQDGSGWDVRAQRYDAAGAAVSGEFRVNSTTASEQYYPTITGLGDGGFVVSWMSLGQDGSSYDVHAQRYDAAGAAVGDEFQINSTTSPEPAYPTITALGEGGFVVSWTSLSQDGSSNDIYAQAYDAAGTRQGSEFRVNSTTASDQAFPTITALADGGFVVGWMSLSQDGSGYDISAQRYDAAGAAVGGEFRINSTTASDQIYPTITALADGGFVVSWMSFGQDGSGWDIFAQRYDAVGAAVGDEFPVNSTTASEQENPTITALGDGGFVVSWMSFGQDGSSWDIYARSYDAAGAAVGDEFRVNSTAASDQIHPTITALSEGGFVVSWMSLSQDGGSYGIYARTYVASNQPSGPANPIADQTSSEDLPWTFQVPADAFSDVEGDALSYSATLADGSALPGWLTFDAATRTFSGTPPANFNGTLSLLVTASDGSLNASDTFDLIIDPVNDAPTGAVTIDGTAREGEVLTTANDIADEDGIGTISYQWLRNGVVIEGATDQTYQLSQPDVGAAISVVATYTDGDGTLESIASAATAPVAMAAQTFTFTGTNAANTFSAPDDSNWIVNGLGGNDRLTTRGGRDQVSGGAGNDTIDTGGNDDVIFFAGANGGFDSISGGAGTDRVAASANTTVIGLASLAGVELITADGFTSVSIAGSGGANSFDFSGTTLEGIERIDLGGGADTLIGSAGADRIVGGAGNDVLGGGAGDDVFEISTGAGDDRIDGGDGFDQVVATRNGVTFNFGALTEVEAISGGDFSNVRIRGTQAADTLDFSGMVLSGIASIDGAGGNDMIIGSEGDDTIVGGGGNDVLDGAGGADTLLGGGGAGRLVGGGGADILSGEGGNDVLEGGEDGDRLTGGAGRDMLTGGTGSDIFAYLAANDSRSANNRDTILDFEQGFDQIDLSVIDASSRSGGNNAFAFIGEAAFNRVAGQLRYQNIGGDTVLEGDINGDGRADFHVLIGGSMEVQLSDLVL